MIISGNIHIVGDDIDTDQMYPTKYVSLNDPAEMAKHCMENYDPAFAASIEKGDILIAGRNFGCGSSREHAPISLKAAGIACVVAKSFSRIFYRNAINIGLPIVACESLCDEIHKGDVITVDLTEGIIVNSTQHKEYHIPPYPEFLQSIIEAGGLIESIRQQRRK